jgi:hypothetical protein
MSPILHLALWFILVVVGYAIVARGLFRATDDLRLSLVDLAAPLLESEGVSEKQKRAVRKTLAHVHSARSAWVLVGMLLTVIVRLPFHKINSGNDEVPASLRINYETLKTRWIVVTLANSPLAIAIFGMILILFFAFVTSLLPLAGILMKSQADDEKQTANA